MSTVFRGAPPPDDEPMPDFGRSLPTPKELAVSALGTTLVTGGLAAAGLMEVVVLFALPILVTHAIFAVPVLRPVLAKRRAAGAARELEAMVASSPMRKDDLRDP